MAAEVKYSWREVGSAIASVRAAGSSQVVNGCHFGAHCSQPPIVASTASTPTGSSIVHGPSLPWCAWWCSRTNSLGSPGKTRNQSRKV